MHQGGGGRRPTFTFVEAIDRSPAPFFPYFNEGPLIAACLHPIVSPAPSHLTVSKSSLTHPRSGARAGA
jgi:hypothetical protein